MCNAIVGWNRVQITELQPDILLLAALLTAKIKEASLTLIPTFGITTILPAPPHAQLASRLCPTVASNLA